MLPHIDVRALRGFRSAAVARLGLVGILAIVGPGLVSGFADNDASGITTYSLAGVHFGYALLWVILASQIVLFFTQEVGARLGLATGQGLTGLVRDRFGVRWAAFVAVTMLVANFGTTLAEYAGIGAALELFGVPLPVSAVAAAVLMVLLISKGSFNKVQYLFIAVGAVISGAYVASAFLAKPDWSTAAVNLFIPHLSVAPAYWLAVVGTVGTTITPWGQAFIQAYVVDKGLRPEDLRGSRLDVALGSGITNVVAGFIVVACAAALWATGQTTVTDAAGVALALGPLAGPQATALFAFGLLAASLLGLGIVPLSSAYTVCEAFGWEAGVEWRWREAPAFYALLAVFVGGGALFVLTPGLPLLSVMFLAAVLNGLLLPFILVFVMLLARDTTLMGPLRSGWKLAALGWALTVVLVIMSLVFVAATVGGSS
ncbi:MAG TPA: Nramp family divalent metal transporter [Candidatus Limnocylindrales bacterium]